MTNTNIINMTKYSGLSVYIIIDGEEVVGKVLGHSTEGKTKVEVYDWTEANEGKGSRSYASASGYGYDKFQAAISKLTFNNVKIFDHSECGSNFRDWQHQLQVMGFRVIQAF